jgi:D-proline reductase (dithiol) PrdB
MEAEMVVDSFKWLPGMLAGYYRSLPVEREEPIPWTPLGKPLSECRFALVTTAAVYAVGREPPFDTEREEREPLWGDPSFRTIPRDVGQHQIGASHLHINNRDILADVNIVLPIHRFLELEAAGEIGSLAPSHYSFMGYQLNTTEWGERYGPEAARRAREEGVDAVLFTPT